MSGTVDVAFSDHGLSDLSDIVIDIALEKDNFSNYVSQVYQQY